LHVSTQKKQKQYTDTQQHAQRTQKHKQKETRREPARVGVHVVRERVE